MYISGYGYFDTVKSPVGDVGEVKIAHSYVDWLHCSSAPIEESGEHYIEDYSHDKPDWMEYTVLSSHYENSAGASGGNDTLTRATHLILRRRESDDSPWLTIAVNRVNDASDFLLDRLDRFAQSGKSYQYIIIPVIDGVESEYFTGNMTDYIDVYFDGIYISDKDDMWGTGFNPDYTRTRNRETSVVTTLASKYPTVTNNGWINYYSGSAGGFFVKQENGVMDLENNVKYRDNVIDFLTNGYPKILRTYDGYIGVVQVDGNVDEQQIDSYLVTNISFNWVEIGDATDYDTLYDNGFIYREE